MLGVVAALAKFTVSAPLFTEVAVIVNDSPAIIVYGVVNEVVIAIDGVGGTGVPLTTMVIGLKLTDAPVLSTAIGVMI